MSRSDLCRSRWSRRQVLRGAGLALGAMALPLPLRLARGEEKPVVLDARTRNALERSPLVYVSPLRGDGKESSCHGEVWFFHDRGDVVLATAADTWKARALALDLDRARIWVGDYGPVKSAGEQYREAPSFVALASRDQDPAAFERLLAVFGEKYPDKWAKWGARFRKGYADGSRRLIRYTPVGA